MTIKRMGFMDNFYFPVRRNEILTVLLGGLVVSSVAMVATWALSTYLVGPIFCKGNTAGPCGDPFSFSYNFFLIISAFAAVGWFAVRRIFRPALIALPSVLMFWSLPMEFGGLLSQGMFSFGLVSVLLITLSYMSLYWIVRIQNFPLVFVMWLLIMLSVRWIIVL